jgi:hypothetical protein
VSGTPSATGAFPIAVTAASGNGCSTTTRSYILYVLAAAPAAGGSLPALGSTVVATGLSSPVAFVQDPTDARVQFVVEQGGSILFDGIVQPDNFRI